MKKNGDAKQVVVVGTGMVGLEVARQLCDRGESVRVVDSDEGRVEKARLMGYEAERINLGDDEELMNLGIGERVDVFFSLLEDDASNVFLVISARALAPDMPIVSISETEETVQRLYAAGATKVIDPYKISGYKIYELMHHPLIAETLERTVFGSDVDLEIAEIPVTASSFLDGVYLDQLLLENEYDLVVLGVVDRYYGDHLIFATDPKRHRIDVDDILVVIGPRVELEKLRKDLEQRKR